MNYIKISDDFIVKKLNTDHINEIFKLCKTNPKYYKYFKEELTKELVMKDLEALPSGKSYADKYYLGFYKNNNLLAIMDLIEKYPDFETVFIGFFMVNKKYQGKKIGRKLIKY